MLFYIRRGVENQLQEAIDFMKKNDPGVAVVDEEECPPPLISTYYGGVGENGNANNYAGIGGSLNSDPNGVYGSGFDTDYVEGGDEVSYDVDDAPMNDISDDEGSRNQGMN
jgi:hypothetical protein